MAAGNCSAFRIDFGLVETECLCNCNGLHCGGLADFNDADPRFLTLERRDPCLGSSAVSKLEYKGERLDIDDAHIVNTSGLR